MSEPGIVDISSYIPAGTLDNFELAEAFGKNEVFVSSRLGARFLPVKDQEQETSDLAVLALKSLCRKTGLDRQTIDCLILCTQNPDGRGLPHTAAIIQDKAALPDTVAAMDISLGCSGYVYGIKVLKGFMAELGARNGVLITADPYSKIIDREDGDTRMLFGDAATATLVSVKDPVFSIGKGLFGTDGSGGEYLQNVGGRLHMNGRQVFNFAATRVPVQVNRLLQMNKISLDEIDKVILHQGSKYIVETLGERLRIPDSKLVFDIKETGNTVSSSIPLLFESHIHDQSIKNVLLSGFGVGFSWGTLLLHRLD